MTLLNQFFSGPFNRIIYKFRYALVFIFFTFGAICIYFGSQIGPLSKQEEFLPNDHPMMVLQKDVESSFPAGGNMKDSIVVNLNWGIEGLDRSGTALWDSDDLGKLIWDQTFTLLPP